LSTFTLLAFFTLWDKIVTQRFLFSVHECCWDPPFS
jgi:hypothetical protein